MSEPYRDNEDWRVEAELADQESAGRLHAAAGARELYRHARRELHNRAALSHDDNLVFAYATTREDAEAAEQALRELAAGESLEATFTLTRWHPIAERWEPADVPLPSDSESVAEEQQENAEEEQQTEAEEGHESGVPEFEVRITMPSHSEAVALAKRLAGEGLPSQRHWHYLLIGAWTEADATALAERLRKELPAEAEIRVEATFAYVLEQDPTAGGPRFSPFALF
jgi:hypothetical protein